jgi:hypothetical protein
VRLLKKPAFLLLFAGIVFSAGCGKKGPMSDAELQKNELNDIYECYTEYIKNNKRPPQQLSELRKYEVMHGLAWRALSSGKFVGVWGLSSKDSGTVLAYAKDAQTQGGAVLMADGSIKNMSADEAQAAIKPAKP